MMNNKLNVLPFHEYLKKARTMKGLSQKKAATMIGVSENTIANWEKGSSVPSDSLYGEIVKVYDLDGEEFSFRHYKAVVKDVEEREERDNSELIDMLLPKGLARRLKNLSLTIEEQEQLGLEMLYLPNHMINSEEMNEYQLRIDENRDHIQYDYSPEYEKRMINMRNRCTNSLDGIPYEYVKQIGAYHVFAIHDSLKEKTMYFRKAIVEFSKYDDTAFNVNKLEPVELFIFCRLLNVKRGEEYCNLTGVMYKIIKPLFDIKNHGGKKYIGDYYSVKKYIKKHFINSTRIDLLSDDNSMNLEHGENITIEEQRLIGLRNGVEPEKYPLVEHFYLREGEKYLKLTEEWTVYPDGEKRLEVYMELTRYGEMLCDFIENQIIPYCNSMREPRKEFYSTVLDNRISVFNMVIGPDSYIKETIDKKYDPIDTDVIFDAVSKVYSKGFDEEEFLKNHVEADNVDC